MTRPAVIIAAAAAHRAQRAIALVAASLARVPPYDSTREYSSMELEPYDALCDRFIRAVETSLKCMRAIEWLEFAEQSDTVRDLLHRMAKLGYICDTELWLLMREARNRIVHDYLPADIAALHADIRGPFAAELQHFGDRLASHTECLSP